MKYIHHFLFLLACGLVFSSCKKDKKEDSEPTYFTPCEQVLDNWDISVFPLPEVQKQRDIFFVNDEVGFTVGNAGTILKSTNGGQDWVFLERYYDLTNHGIVPGALTKADLNTVYFVDDQVGYAGGDGENTPLSGGNIDAILLKTTDGGETWVKQYLSGIEEVKELYFYDADYGVGIFSTNDENGFLKYKLFSTQNAGATWEAVSMPNLTINNPRFDVTGNSLGVGVVEHYHSSKYLRTSNMGVTWKEVPVPSSSCNSIGFKTESEGYAYYCDGKSYKTMNGGATWEEYTDLTPVGATLAHYNSLGEGFAIVPVYDQKEGGGEVLSILNSFEVYQTVDGGNTWYKSVIDKECDFTGVAFNYSDDVFFTVGWEAVNRFKRK